MMYRVLKFGGSSVASATNISRVLDIVGEEAKRSRVILVCSAISGCTDALLKMAGGDLSGTGELMERHLAIVRRLFTGAERRGMEKAVRDLFDQLKEAPAEEKVTFGELLSTTLIARKLTCDGFRTLWLDSRKLVVKGDQPATYRRIEKALKASSADIFVAPGFICGTPDGGVSTLGRGGSDYSAALFAAACHAGSLQIWTDVPGIMTANPRQVPSARTIPEMSYEAALKMARHGAKVLYAPTVAPAMEAGIAIEIRNTFAPGGGKSMICAEPAVSTGPWTGVASTGKDGLCEICLVGSGEGDIPAALSSAGIAPLSVKKSADGYLVQVRPCVETPALQALHRAFFETLPCREVNLFIAGYGAVGKALVDMVRTTAPTVAERTGKTLRIVGVADSSRYVIDLGGILPSEADGRLARGAAGSYADAICALAPKGAVFVDCTDSEDLYQSYIPLFQAGLNIVSSNRRSFAVPYVQYASMHAAARENGAFFRFETTVGAALPILESIARGANSCDEVLSIEAVVSCTMNQILGDYQPGGGETFASLVRRAQRTGLTEPDPRVDLGGRDVLRKLLILSREAGVQMEEADVEIHPLIPSSLFGVSLDAFYDGLEALEPTFAARVLSSREKGCRLRFTATLEKDPAPALGYKAAIRIVEVPQDHPAYYLRGTENAIIIRSSFHPYPLVIQGPGEGARQAASSILNDILR